MYNRYIPDGTHYVRVPQEDRPAPDRRAAPQPPKAGGLGSLAGLLEGNSISQSVSSLLKVLHLDDLDTGDILLALIVLFLILEDGDNLDLIITLGLMILLSLGET